MIMKTLSLILIGLMLIASVSAAPVVAGAVNVDKVSLFSGRTGNVSPQSSYLNGELLAIAFVNGNFTSESIVNVTATYPMPWNITTWDLSDGDNLTTKLDTFYKMPLYGRLNVSLVNAQANKSATVYIIYR
jgi:hypothetical protein